MKKFLIYYTIGGSPDYANLLKFSVETLFSHPENRALFDVLVMCDKNYAPNIACRDMFPIQHVYITGDNKSPVDASMRKTEIFDFEHLHQYEKVMYLDCDITVGTSLAAMMDNVTRTDALYVIPEGKNLWDHNHFFYCPQDKVHSQEMLMKFASRGIRPFNAGQFAFRPGNTMRCLFAQVANAKKHYDPRLHFYEQGFMNYYFNLAGAVDYAIDTYVTFARWTADYVEMNAINHFADVTLPGVSKLNMMKSHWHRCRGK